MKRSNHHDNFDEFARDYRSIHTKTLGPIGGTSASYGIHKALQVADLMANDSSGVFLDYGCGDGIVTQSLAGRFPDWTFFGADVSEESLAVAAESTAANIIWTVIDGFSLPFSDSTFDVIFVANVFHHVDYSKHREILNEFYRTLKPLGKVVFYEHNPRNYITRKIVDSCPFDNDAVLLDPDYGKEIFVQTGFAPVDVRYVLFFPRHWIFFLFWWFERYMEKIPAGAQYRITARKAKSE